MTPSAMPRLSDWQPRMRASSPAVTRFKGLGEMNPSQLRETTIDPRTRRLVQLTIEAKDQTDKLMDMLLAKKRAGDRREWLERKGNLAEVIGLMAKQSAELRGHRAPRRSVSSPRRRTSTIRCT